MMVTRAIAIARFPFKAIDGGPMTCWTLPPCLAGAIEMSTNSSAAKQGGNVQHVIGPPSIALNGNRAIAIARVTIMVRGIVHGTLVDVACTGRFHDWLARGADGWKIVQRMPIYEKDRMDPVEPGATVNLDKTLLERISPGYRYLGYLQTLGGTAVITDLPAPGSAEERKLYDDSAAWLAGG